METSAEEAQVQLSSDPKYLGLGFTVFGDKVQTGSQQSVISSKMLCQILCTMRLQRISKILTPRRMLQKTY